MNIIPAKICDISFKEYVDRLQLLCRKHLTAMRLEESGGTAANGYHHTIQTIMTRYFIKIPIQFHDNQN